MNDENPRQSHSTLRVRSDLEQVFADKMPAKAAGAVAGLAIAGPAGAIIGAMLSPPLEYILKNGNERYLRSAVSVISEAAGDHMTIEQLADYVKATDERLDLLTKAVKAASDTLNDDKLRGLSRALRLGLHDDARIDIAGLAVSAIARLEAAHLKVLGLLVLDDCVIRRGWGQQELHRQLPNLSEGLFPVLTVLTGEGLIHKSNEETYYVDDFGCYVYWMVATPQDQVVKPYWKLRYATTSAQPSVMEWYKSKFTLRVYSEKFGEDSEGRMTFEFVGFTDVPNEVFVVRTGNTENDIPADRVKGMNIQDSQISIFELFTQRPEHFQEPFLPATPVFKEIRQVPFHPTK